MKKITTYKKEYKEIINKINNLLGITEKKNYVYLYDIENSENIKEGISGFHYASTEELMEKTNQLMNNTNLNKKISEKDYRILVDNIILIQSENYVTKRKKTKEELLKVLELTP